MYKIPLQVLLASCVCVAKKDIREYFNYVRVQDGYVASTDGHRLLLCDIDGLDKTFSLFIHPKDIKELCKGVINSARYGDVSISIERSNSGTNAVMTFGQNTISFPPVNVGNYPNVKRIIPASDGVVDTMFQFNWQYLADMQKVAKLLGYSNFVRVKPTGINKPALIEFSKRKFSGVGTLPKSYEYNFSAVGVVSPLLER